MLLHHLKKAEVQTLQRSSFRSRLRLRPRKPEDRSEMSLLNHLEELRRRLSWVAASVALAGVAGWFAFDRVVELLLKPARPYLTDLSDGDLVFNAPLEAFSLRMKIALYVGFTLAFPVVLVQLWRFVSPGLRKAERKHAIPFIAAALVLFSGGVMFAYATLPQALRFLIGPEITGANVSPLLGAKAYLSFGLMYHAAFGLAFELPVLLMALSLLRVISSQQMASHRKQTFLILAVASAVLTPSADWMTMLALAVAMYVLFETCIWLSRLLKR